MSKCLLCGHESEEGQGTLVQAFIATYCELFKLRYGSNPPIQGVDAGIAKRLIKDIGSPRATKLIEAYLGIDDFFFVSRRHDLKTFQTNLTKISVAVDTGEVITQNEAKRMERRAGNKNAFRGLLEEE